MITRAWIRGMSAGTLMIAGMVTSSSFIASAQQSGTPAAGQTAAQSAGEGQEQGPPVLGTPLLQPAIDLTRAQEIALEGQANAVVIDIDLNGDDGLLAYSVTLDTGIEVDVDATTGTVVKTEEVDNGDAEGDEDSRDESDNGENYDNGDNSGESHATSDNGDEAENDNGGNHEDNDNGDDHDNDQGNNDENHEDAD